MTWIILVILAFLIHKEFPNFFVDTYKTIKKLIHYGLSFIWYISLIVLAFGVCMFLWDAYIYPYLDSF